MIGKNELLKCVIFGYFHEVYFINEKNKIVTKKLSAYETLKF